MRTLVVGPHPDDELLGCGGLLLRRKDEGGTIAWLLMTSMNKEMGYSKDRMHQRESEIQKVRASLKIHKKNFFALNYPTAGLDQIPLKMMVENISNIFHKFKPEEILIPYPGDAHSDHRITFYAVTACTKWFRHPSVKRILVYETLSETEFGIDPRFFPFKPNLFVNITNYIDQKINLMNIYESEMGHFPFPRSEKTLRALATVNGSKSGFEYAESFILLRELL